jgi:hypothetical protein
LPVRSVLLYRETYEVEAAGSRESVHCTEILLQRQKVGASGQPVIVQCGESVPDVTFPSFLRDIDNLYELDLRDTVEGVRLFWQMKEDWRDSREGAYLLRTNLKGETAEKSCGRSTCS